MVIPPPAAVDGKGTPKEILFIRCLRRLWRSRGVRRGLWSAFSLRLLVLTRLIVRVLRCGGADWCGLVLGRVESWVRALGFPPFSLSPDPPDLLDARHKTKQT